MLLPPSELSLGESYLRDDFDVEGDLGAAVHLGDVLADRLRSPVKLARVLSQLRDLPADDLAPSTAGHKSRLTGRRHSRQRDAAAVRFHYDAGNEFYALWLDRRMVYSCAYFETGAEDLDTAQEAKLEHICRKLRLKQGERLLDIGCGWGGLIHYAAERYGVHATGITLNKPQAMLARARLADAGLSQRGRVEVRDYRDLPRGTVFDKVVSVGMFEHVGRPQLPEYFATAYRLTKPGGLFLNHGIVDLSSIRTGAAARWASRLLWRQGAFIQRYVFPDGELLAQGESILLAERAGWETRDIESLREHYVLTLRHWVKRLEARKDQATALVGDPTYRVWRLYMAASERGFAAGRIGITQALYSKPDARGASGLPLTRADLYAQPWRSG